ncbi:kappa-type opioid receptor-like isoform X2 [Watersipora subatra]|uniref:kappa-type opioid receptor-like isoform X2 n=1 Tax=Watersipora subatra TaxID=2589382 RepID=UPI00355BA5EE
MDEMESRGEDSLQSNSTIEEPKVSSDTISVVLAIQTAILLVGVILNIINIFILAKGRKFGRRIKIQLINVAVADILSALMVPGSSPVYSYATLTRYPNIQALCKTHKFVGYSSFYASLLFHGTIAIERFVSVYFPLRMSRYKKTHVIIVIILGWMISFASTNDMILTATLVPTDTGFTCFANLFGKSRLTLNVTTYFVKILIPSIVIVVMYTMIAVRLHKKKIFANNKSKDSRSRQVLAMLAANGVLAVLIWTPYFIFLLALYASHMNIPNSDTIAMTLCGIVYINCFITPLVYLAFNHDYRKDAKQVLCKNRLISGDYEPTNSRDQSAPVDSVSAAMHIKHNCNPTNQK